MKTTLAALVLIAGCASTSTPPVQNAPPSGDFAKFVDDYFAARFAAAPSSATHAGIHEHDAELEDLSRAGIEKRLALLKSFAARLDGLDRQKMSFDDTVDAEALKNAIANDILNLETIRPWENNPMFYSRLPGGAIDGLMKRDFAPAKDRLRSVIARMKQIPAVYVAAKANLKTPPKEFTDIAIRMTQGSVHFFDAAVVGWAKQAAGDDAALLAEFTAADTAAVAAVKDFAAWLEKDLKPRSTGSFVLGEKLFAELLKDSEMVDMPIADLLATGEAQLAKDYAAFVATAKKIDPTKSPADVMKAISLEHPTADDLIPAVGRSLEETRKFVVDKDIITIPSEVRPKVEETPPYARGGSFASMDTPGAYEHKATEAFYYVTPVEKDWDAKHQEEHLRLYNRPVILLIDIHEAFPGHYVQFLYSPQFPTKTRKLTFAGTNAEGWAHYAEQMIVDEGFGGGDPKIRLAQLAEALVRDCRYVVGVRLHTRGMTLEEGAKLFVDKAFMEPANAYEEARRGTFNPTYLYYTLGKIEIQKLSGEYRAKTGKSLKDFHNAFVAQGSLPIPLVRKLLLERPAK